MNQKYRYKARPFRPKSNKHKFKQDKSLGQHWLQNVEFLNRISFAAGNGPLCVEIGAGPGFLTKWLLDRFDKVIAIEVDERYATSLPKSFVNRNLEVVHEDVLKYDFEQINGEYTVAGNIPYYITKSIVIHVLSAKNRPQRVSLLMQREVAEKIAAKGGRHSPLSLWVENRADIDLQFVVPAYYFVPRPEVDSRLLVLTPHAPIYDDDKMFELISEGFKWPRKKMIHNLTSYHPSKLEEAFEKCELDRDLRAENLTLEDWHKLYEELKK